MRTPLFVQKQSGGMFSVINDELTTGNIYFVSSLTGTDVASNGMNPDAPFATINFAISQCTASNYDRIFVMPGHSEVLTAAAGIALNKIGVTIIGLGKGALRPKITYTTSAAASFDVTAASCSVKNIWFSGVGVATVTAMINVQASDFTIDTCSIELANATNQAAIGILTTAAGTRMMVTNCYFYGSNNGTTTPIQIVGGDSHRIINNIFTGAFVSGQGAINQVTTTTTNCIVQFNYINNLTAGCTKGMVFTASSTGQISDNCFQVLGGTAPITGAAMSWVGYNCYAATIATGMTQI